MISVVSILLFLLPTVFTASAKRAYQRWLLQLRCWFGENVEDDLSGYQCLDNSYSDLADYQTIDLLTHGGWTSLAFVMQIDESDKVKLKYPVCTPGSEPVENFETVELFSGRLAPFGAFGGREKHSCVTIKEDDSTENTEQAIVIGKSLREKDSPKLKNVIYELDRDWTVVFRDIGVMLPDVELKIDPSDGRDISGTYLETGERFDGRAVYQFDNQFLVWDSVEKKWIINTQLGSRSKFAYNKKQSFSADLLGMSWVVKEGGKWVERTDGTIKAVTLRDLKNKLFYPGTAVVKPSEVYQLNNGVIMPRIGLGTGGLY